MQLNYNFQFMSVNCDFSSFLLSNMRQHKSASQHRNTKVEPNSKLQTSHLEKKTKTKCKILLIHRHCEGHYLPHVHNLRYLFPVCSSSSITTWAAQLTKPLLICRSFSKQSRNQNLYHRIF